MATFSRNGWQFLTGTPGNFQQEYANYTRLTNNYVFNNGGSGISAPRGDYEILYKNVSRNNGATGITLFYMSTPSENWCDRNLLLGNISVLNKEHGIHINGTYNIIKSNIIATNLKDGLNHSGSDNFVTGNSIFSNHATGIWLGGASGLVISNNQIYLNDSNGIGTVGLDGTRVIENNIYRNNSSGLSFWWGDAAQDHYIKKNTFHNNGLHGLFIDGSYNYIISNSFYSNNNNGFEVVGDEWITNMYNNAWGNGNNGMYIRNFQTTSLVRNSTFYKNGSAGIRVDNADGLIIRNCISVSNNIGYNNFYSLTYSLAFGNTISDYSQIPGTGCVTNDPYFSSIIPFSTNFLHLSGTQPSPAINTGDPSDTVPSNGGSIVDMGFHEYLISSTLFDLKKECAVSINGLSTPTIPGATIEYMISVSNYGISIGDSVVVYDKLPSNSFITYISNSYTNSQKKWQVEWSTNNNPDQSWGSSDYINNDNISGLIKWIRWKKIAVGKLCDIALKYCVIID